PDLVVGTQYDASFSSGGVSVLLGDGAGEFASPTIYSTGGTDLLAVAVADLNGDTLPDIVTSNYFGNNVSVFLNDGTGAFSPRTDIAAGSNPTTVVSTDLDGDGKADLVVADDYDATSSSGAVSVLLGDGSGGYRGATSFSTGGYYPTAA